MPPPAHPVETALWLVPRKEDGRRLEAVIRELARRFDAPVFAPHVTVFGGVTLPLPRLEPVLRRAAGAVPPCTLAAPRLAHTADFFRCVFLEVEEPSPVSEMRRHLAPDLGRRPEDAAHPHVSLLYAELPEARRESLCRELASDLAGAWHFDALEVVAPRRDDLADWRDVDGWRILRRLPLLGDAPP